MEGWGIHEVKRVHAKVSPPNYTLHCVVHIIYSALLKSSFKPAAMHEPHMTHFSCTMQHTSIWGPTSLVDTLSKYSKNRDKAEHAKP